jgi:hypothetical protein
VQFRVSSLPFCPLLFAISQKNYSPDKPDPVEFKSGFFFDQGHALHSLWQKTALNATPTEIIGDWRCNHVLSEKVKDNKVIATRCNRLVPFCSAKDMLKVKCPHNQPNCKLSQVYSELGSNEAITNDLNWHGDALFRERKNKKRYHVVDWKTTGLFLFDKPNHAIKMGYYPNKKYIE